jgi:hypothetical protein
MGRAPRVLTWRRSTAAGVRSCAPGLPLRPSGGPGCAHRTAMPYAGWMRSFTLALLVAVVVVPAASAADIPFKDGPGSAQRLAQAMNKTSDFNEVTCRYARPLVRCRGLVKWPAKSDTYYRFTMAVHKTAPKKGYRMTCITAFGICKKQAMQFSV